MHRPRDIRSRSLTTTTPTTAVEDVKDSARAAILGVHWNPLYSDDRELRAAMRRTPSDPLEGIPEKHHETLGKSSDAKMEAKLLQDYYAQNKEIKNLQALVSECAVISGRYKHEVEKANKTEKAMRMALAETMLDRPKMKSDLRERGFSLKGT
jgi:predicted lipoprotein